MQLAQQKVGVDSSSECILKFLFSDGTIHQLKHIYQIHGSECYDYAKTMLHFDSLLLAMPVHRFLHRSAISRPAF